MAYLLESKEEFYRLEKQSHQKAYDLSTELSHINLKSHQQVVDIGCGSGVLCRYLSDIFPKMEITGIDKSRDRILQAQAHNENTDRIQYIAGEIDSLENKFDLAICRYVLEHLEDPLTFLNKVKSVLKPGGKFIIIDFDGFMMNFHTENKRLINFLDILVKCSGVDFYIGRKIPSLLEQSGFSNITWQIQTVGFDSPLQKQEEMGLCRERFKLAESHLNDIFLDKCEYNELVDLYLNQISKETIPLFYNKFVVECVLK